MLYSEISQLLKDIAAVGKTLQDQEINSKIIDLQGMIMDLMQENQELSQKVNEFDSIKNKKKLLKKFGNFWAQDAETLAILNKQKAPYDDELTTSIYCPRCLAQDNKLVPVNNFQQFDDLYELICPVCEYSAIVR